MGNFCKENEKKLQIIGIFISPTGHNSVKNGLIRSKTELGKDILAINLYTQFQSSQYVQSVQIK
jgi:hypothetical protein